MNANKIVKDNIVEITKDETFIFAPDLYSKIKSYISSLRIKNKKNYNPEIIIYRYLYKNYSKTKRFISLGKQEDGTIMYKLC